MEYDYWELMEMKPPAEMIFQWRTLVPCSISISMSTKSKKSYLLNLCLYEMYVMSIQAESRLEKFPKHYELNIYEWI